MSRRFEMRRRIRFFHILSKTWHSLYSICGHNERYSHVYTYREDFVGRAQAILVEFTFRVMYFDQESHRRPWIKLFFFCLTRRALSASVLSDGWIITMEMYGQVKSTCCNRMSLRRAWMYRAVKRLRDGRARNSFKLRSDSFRHNVSAFV